MSFRFPDVLDPVEDSLSNVLDVSISELLAEVKLLRIVLAVNVDDIEVVE